MVTVASWLGVNKLTLVMGMPLLGNSIGEGGFEAGKPQGGWGQLLHRWLGWLVQWLGCILGVGSQGDPHDRLGSKLLGLLGLAKVLLPHSFSCTGFPSHGHDHEVTVSVSLVLTWPGWLKRVLKG